MATLRNLNEIFSKATERFDLYDGKDFILPQDFKDKVKEINSNKVTYNQYSAIIETKGNQNGELNIFLPNQWFYIASYFTDLYNELLEYKANALKVASKERLKELNGGVLSSDENKRLANLDLDDDSKEYLLKFMTNYSWWNGAKTIDRGDFYVSPILTCAKLVNASQSFVADLCAFLANKTELIKAIIATEENTNRAVQKLIISENKLTSFILSTINYFNEKDGLNSIVPYASSTSPIKVSKDNEFRLTGMFLESTLDDVKERNENHQRWFEDIFYLGEREVFLSTQWNGSGNYQLTLPDFLNMIKCCYGKKYTYRQGQNGEHQLYLEEEEIKVDDTNKKPLQQIFYGAPGTGKSFEINRLTKNKEVIRTTFHPDSDYSTFVGAYKPTSVEVPVRDVTGKVIIENGQKVTENRIVYEFVEQAFLQAYIKAWKAYADIDAGETPEEQYLVIEEINRGNCAQIFGDLFQLLDRNKAGFSDYPITADKDMKKQLAKAFKDMTIADAARINSCYDKDIVSKVLSGDILLLPDNLYIWATMNTSDQSLFPIDSAFKRRWDWKYVPISEGVTETGTRLGYKLKVSGKLYDWWSFINKINNEIGELTKSEDKKLGYFFCKANGETIDAETFVSKVVFYLWNDVFKDQDVASIFNDGDEELTFSMFYDTDIYGKAIVKEDKVEVLLKNLGLEPLSATEEQGDGDSPSSELLVKYKGVTIEGTSSISKYIEIINRVVEEKGVDIVANCLGADITRTPTDNTRGFKEIGNTGWYLATNFGIAKMKVNLNKVEASLGVGIAIE